MNANDRVTTALIEGDEDDAFDMHVTTTQPAGLGPWETALRDVKGMYETYAAQVYAQFPGTLDTAQDYAETWTLRHGTYNTLAGNPVTTWGYYGPEGQFIPIAHVSTPADLRNLGARLYRRPWAPGTDPLD